MPSAIDTLIGRIADAQLRADIRAAVSELRKVTDFGLVFEAHLPETVRLPQHSVRRGIKVTLRDLTDQSMFEVVSVDKKIATIRRVRNPDGSALSRDAAAEVEQQTQPLASLIALAEFGDPIYPGMRHLGSVERGGAKPSHVVIEGENHHVLQALQFSHAGKIDCIYLDPPYNSGARDWTYNNDYVDSDDAYRHSKWLAFMSRRLQLAKQLLNPDASVLIVTIDEKEYLRLGLLLHQMFPNATMQMVSTLVNPKGTGRVREFRRVDEYIFFLLFGAATLGRLPDTAQVVTPPAETNPAETNPQDGNGATETSVRTEGEHAPLEVPLDWQTFRRRDLASKRGTKKGGPAQFYPIYVNKESGRIEAFGEPLAQTTPRDRAPTRQGCVAVFPVRPDGTEMNWALTVPTAELRLKKGYVRAGRASPNEPQRYVIQYLKSGPISDVEEGRANVIGRDEDGSIIAVYPAEQLRIPTTQWRIPSHNAEHYGTGMLKSLLPRRSFPFPKSLYAVEDALRLFVAHNPDAKVLDFFAGSGTTAHAVMRLNRQDGGRRQSISVTNNEVSDAEANELHRQGRQPGDPDWERLGIFEQITRPRVTAAITGMTPDGDAISGHYKFVDEFPMAQGFDENVDFFELTYLDAAQIEVDRAFEGIAPLLWFRAGARGLVLDRCLDGAGRRKPFAWTEQYGVLFNTDCWRPFVSLLPNTATTAYIVTDSITEFSHIAGELPGSLDVVRIYERYLTTFEVSGR
jgi:adenine-specific DNA-methyltransferase